MYAGARMKGAKLPIEGEGKCWQWKFCVNNCGTVLDNKVNDGDYKAEKDTTN